MSNKVESRSGGLDAGHISPKCDVALGRKKKNDSKCANCVRMIGSMLIGLGAAAGFLDRPSLDLLLTTCNILYALFFKAGAFALDRVSRFLQKPPRWM